MIMFILWAALIVGLIWSVVGLILFAQCQDDIHWNNMNDTSINLTFVCGPIIWLFFVVIKVVKWWCRR